MRIFVSGTGTDVGKTWLGRGLAARLRELGRDVVALKPIETGCDPEPLDALALASACGRPELAHAPGLHRGRLPLAPWAATLAGDPPPPPLDTLHAAIDRLAAEHEAVIVEGAGGLLVPYDPTHDLADLARRLGYPLLLVAPDVLGTLSHVLTAAESARARGLELRAVALTSAAGPVPLAAEGNARILEQRLGLPIHRFPRAEAPPPALLDALLRDLDPTYRR